MAVLLLRFSMLLGLMSVPMLFSPSMCTDIYEVGAATRWGRAAHSVVICLFVIFVISHSGFEGRIFGPLR